MFFHKKSLTPSKGGFKLNYEAIIKRAVENNYFDTNTRYRYTPSEYAKQLENKIPIDDQQLIETSGIIPILNSNSIAKGDVDFGNS